MKSDAHERLLSSGKFAAATKLSSKALRFYGEQRLLRPAAVGPASRALARQHFRPLRDVHARCWVVDHRARAG